MKIAKFGRNFELVENQDVTRQFVLGPSPVLALESTAENYPTQLTRKMNFNIDKKFDPRKYWVSENRKTCIKR